MIIIAGLGNPKEEYSQTRHNIGFRATEKIKEKYNLSDFKLQKKIKSNISKGIIDDQEIILLQPLTYMNKSGEALKRALSYYDVPLSNLIVIHDDADLDFGTIKVSDNKGSAGHKGIKSIIESLGLNNFKRIRFGIGLKTEKKIKAEEFVLKNFSTEEEKEIPFILENICLNIEEMLKEI